jgi:hypothetical protein
MKITELRDVRIGIEQIEPHNGHPVYRLSLTDDRTREVLWLSFGQETADGMLAAITGIQVVQKMPRQ